MLPHFHYLYYNTLFRKNRISLKIIKNSPPLVFVKGNKGGKKTDVWYVLRYDVLAIVKSKVIPGSTIQFEFLIGYSQYAFIVIVEFAGGGALNLS